jgi:hypothetical protein
LGRWESSGRGQALDLATPPGDSLAAIELDLPVGQDPSLDLDEIFAKSGRLSVDGRGLGLPGLLAPLGGRLGFLEGLQIGGDPALV